MSVSLSSHPHRFAFAKNRNAFLFSCNGSGSTGSLASATFKIHNAVLASGAVVVLSLNDSEVYRWHYSATAAEADQFKFHTLGELFSRLQNCYYLKGRFHINGSVSFYLSVTLTAIDKGRCNINISAEGVSDGVELVSRSVGSDASLLPNYGLGAALEVSVNDLNNVSTVLCDPVVYSPDASGNVLVSLPMLPSFFATPDLPAVGEDFGIYLCTNALLKYRLRYMEIYGEQPLFQPYAETEFFYALQGELAAYYAGLNLPDWDESNKSVQMSYRSAFYPLVIGEDNNVVCEVRAGQPVYAYFLFYNSSLGFTAAANVSVRYRVNGGAWTRQYITCKNGCVYRVAIGPDVVGASSGYYEVQVYYSESSIAWQRTFEVLPAFRHQHVFLLQDKYGFMKSFVAAKVAVEHSSEGDGALVDGSYLVNVTDSFVSYKVVTPFLSRSDFAALAQALSNEHQYYLAAGAWHRVFIEPTSLTVADEDSNLLQCEFSFRFADNLTENIGTNGTRAVSPGDLVNVSSFVDSLAQVSANPTSNNLFS